MKIRFNWGTGIVVAIIIMVLFISTLVYITTKQDFFLVEEDYYEQGVKYQEKIDKRKNTKELAQKIGFNRNNENLEFTFPEELSGNELNGTIYFYNPTNKLYDYKTAINTDKSLKQKVNISALKKGRYIIKIDWKTESKSYYQEENINIR